MARISINALESYTLDGACKTAERRSRILQDTFHVIRRNSDEMFVVSATLKHDAADVMCHVATYCNGEEE